MNKNKRRARPGAMSRTPPLDSASSVTSAMVQQAVALHLNGRLEQAEVLYRQVLDRHRDTFDATHLLGVVAMQAGRWVQAVDLLSRATQLNSNHPQALANFGSALLYANRPDEALRQYDRALELDPRFAGALNNHGNALQMLGRHEEAAESFRRLLELAPQFDFALGNCFQSRRHCGDWQDFSLQVADVLEALSAGRRVDRPFSFLSVSGEAAHQLECARSYAIYMCPSAQPALWTGERYTHERIRVAYISADFRAHVVSNLMVAIYERHDRERFHTIGVSLTADDGADVVIRARNSLTQFVDASRLSDDEAARLIRELEVDIAVDLTGYTQGCRPGIFARRPAPVQINFLGFPATLGVPYIDYIIADEFAIPASSESAYAECVVRMPDSFQPNDARDRNWRRYRRRCAQKSACPARASYSARSTILTSSIRPSSIFGRGSCGRFPTASCGSSVTHPPFGVICVQRLQPAALSRHASSSPRGCHPPSISRDCAWPICSRFSSVQCRCDCQRCLVVRCPRADLCWRRPRLEDGGQPAPGHRPARADYCQRH